jgi:hypothetical protein
MIDAKHTPGPWHTSGSNKCTVYDKFGQRIVNSFEGVMATQRSDTECAFNAQRIVACVNACEGLSMEFLERIDSIESALIGKLIETQYLESLCGKMEMGVLMTKTMKVEGPLHVVCQCDICKAQPEQEPVAWMDGTDLTVRADIREKLNYKGSWVDMDRAIPHHWVPFLYTTPPQRSWVGLTDAEIKEIVGPYGDTPVKGYTRKLFDQIETKLKEKNNG